MTIELTFPCSCMMYFTSPVRAHTNMIFKVPVNFNTTSEIIVYFKGLRMKQEIIEKQQVKQNKNNICNFLKDVTANCFTK